LNATKESNICAQNSLFFPLPRHITYDQEDCLYLNVYTPSVTKKLPVMFWIHGGGFSSGHSGSSYYGADYFMDKDVVFVSLNYRLGLLGNIYSKRQRFINNSLNV